jgi:hypothetical protein
MAAMGLKLAADMKVDAFGVTLDEGTTRLDFPRAEADHLEGASGSLRYGIDELVFDKLHARLDVTHWQAEAGSAGRVWLRTENGSIELVIGRVELPHGVMIVRSGTGDVEIVAPHALLADTKISAPDLAALRSAPAPGDDAPPPAKPAAKGLVQEKLRFLDALAGEVRFTIRVELDLPVLGVRRLDQVLRIPIKDGSLDFRALDKSLDFLEGAFLDIKLDGRRLAVKWGVPIIAPAAKDIVWWELDSDAQAQAAFGRVPLRSLADIRFPDDDKPKRPDRPKKSILRSFTIGKIEAALSLVAPRRLDVAGGTILLGGDDAPGIVDLELTGTLTHPPETGGPGALLGAIGVLDSTLKDVHLGGVALTVDRLHFGAIETIGVSFEGFKPAGVVATVNRITADNLRLVLGAQREPAAMTEAAPTAETVSATASPTT